MPPFLIFDGLLGLVIVAVAIRALVAPDSFQAVVHLVVFGLLMALAWSRLDAVDVSLAEAAIGAGLTGALFLNAIAQKPGGMARGPVDAPGGAPRLMVLLLAAGALVLIGASFMGLPSTAPGLTGAVAARLAQSGAANPVTAVLLNFRAYDTLLEMAVLMVAAAGVWSLGSAAASPRAPGVPSGPVLLAFVRVLIPFIGVVAGYLLWTGTKGPGGAFQAGAVLGASGVLLVVAGLARPAPHLPIVRAAAAIGFVAFLAAGAAALVRGRRLLEYVPARAETTVLVLEALLTISIATILVALFTGRDAGRRPEGRNDP
jgi:multisubunit Na+/H+ antiporter MnhB subunit